MTDPWLVEANRLNVERAEADLAQARAAQQHIPQPPRRDPMDVAIEEAIFELKRFIDERGAAARALLAARNKGEYIEFAADNHYGSYHGVYFDKLGLRESRQRPNPYAEDKSFSVRADRAVTFFAWHGDGYKDPDKVRAIVDWFRAQVDDLARQS